MVSSLHESGAQVSEAMRRLLRNSRVRPGSPEAGLLGSLWMNGRKVASWRLPRRGAHRRWVAVTDDHRPHLAGDAFAGSRAVVGVGVSVGGRGVRRGVGVGVGVGGPIVGATVTTGVSRPGVANGVGVWKNEVGMGVISGSGWARRSAGRIRAAWKSGRHLYRRQRDRSVVVERRRAGLRHQRRTATRQAARPRTRAGPGRPRRLVLRRQLVYTRCRRRDRPLWKPKTTIRAIRRVLRIARSAVRTIQTVTLCRTSTEYRFGVSRSPLQSVGSG